MVMMHGLLELSSHQRRMVECIEFQTFKPSMRLLNASTALSQRSKRFFCIARITSFFQSLISECNTALLSWTKKARIFAPFATPWGLFQHTCLPMCVSPAPGIAQEIMEHVWAALVEEIEACFDDVAALSDDWETHLVLLEKLLTWLQEKGFLVNPAMCK